VRNFITGRVPTLIGQLRSVGWYPSINPATFSQHGGYLPSTQQLFIDGAPGTIYYTVNGPDPRRPGGTIDPNVQVFLSGNTSDVDLIASGSTWRYLDDGSDQGTSWRELGFNDSAWQSGPAQLGYGEGDEATLIGFGPSASARNITTYFRHTFNATGTGSINSLSLGLLRDDGAIVYLNGNEIARSNLPAGEITSLTLASSNVGGADESTFLNFDVPPAAMVEGTNTLAVELHQVSGGSSDTSFDLRLSAEQLIVPNPLLLASPGVNIVRTRLLNNGEWSAITEATFLVDTDPASASNLAITEIHYRPSPPSAAELSAGFNERSDFEFIELENVSLRHIDLGGLAFSTGITFEFDDSLLGRTLAPGERILLVNKREAFEMRYGSSFPIAGEFSGSLSNDGEQLVITGPDATPIIDLTYNDAAPWPASADGDGYSLILIDPASSPDSDDPASWRTSAAANGNPGASDALSYASWKLANGISIDDGDPDGDGLTHFMEYALGGLPFQASPSSDPGASVQPLDVGSVVDNYLVFELRRRLGADDVSIAPQISTDLAAWLSGPPALVLATAINNNDGTETLTFRSGAPVEDGSHQFVRAQFALKP
jgi:hypothetical protein